MKRYLGIDLGGTTMRVAIVSAEGAVEKKLEVPTEVHKGPKDVIHRLAEMLNQIDSKAEFSVVGFGLPGPLNIEKGCMLDAPNFPGWANVPLVESLEKLTGKKVVFENDANVAALGEALVGGGKCQKSTFFMTVSTGVGGGIVVEEKLLTGSHGYAGEVGCMIISNEDRNHLTLPAGSLESLCSGTALTKLSQNLYGEQATAADLFQKYQAGEEGARHVVQTFITNFAKAIGTLQQVVDPDVFVLGGSVILHNQWLCPLIEKEAQKYVYQSLAEHIHIKVAQLGGDAGLVGAALLTR